MSITKNEVHRSDPKEAPYLTPFGRVVVEPQLQVRRRFLSLSRDVAINRPVDSAHFIGVESGTRRVTTAPLEQSSHGPTRGAFVKHSVSVTRDGSQSHKKRVHEPHLAHRRSLECSH